MGLFLGFREVLCVKLLGTQAFDTRWSHLPPNLSSYCLDCPERGLEEVVYVQPAGAAGTERVAPGQGWPWVLA